MCTGVKYQFWVDVGTSICGACCQPSKFQTPFLTSLILMPIVLAHVGSISKRFTLLQVTFED